jgi:hypothetical protein
MPPDRQNRCAQPDNLRFEQLDRQLDPRFRPSSRFIIRMCARETSLLQKQRNTGSRRQLTILPPGLFTLNTIIFSFSYSSYCAVGSHTRSFPRAASPRSSPYYGSFPCDAHAGFTKKKIEMLDLLFIIHSHNQMLSGFSSQMESDTGSSERWTSSRSQTPYTRELKPIQLITFGGKGASPTTIESDISPVGHVHSSNRIYQPLLVGHADRSGS